MPIYTTYNEDRKYINRYLTLFSFDDLLELFQPDIADIKCFAWSPVDPKYCILAVDLFTFKIYIYLKESRSIIKRELDQFYGDLESKEKSVDATMRIQTVQELPKQNKKN